MSGGGRGMEGEKWRGHQVEKHSEVRGDVHSMSVHRLVVVVRSVLGRILLRMD